MSRRGIILVLIFAIFSATTAESDDHDHNGHSVDAFEEVKEFFNTTGERLADEHVSHLVEELLERVQCDKTGVNCTQCLPNDRLYQAIDGNKTLGLDEEEYHQSSVILLYHLSDLSNACNTSQSRNFSWYLTKLSEAVQGVSQNQSQYISEEVFEQFLVRLNASYVSGELDHGDDDHDDHDDHGHEGEEHNETTCISAESLFETVNITRKEGASQEELEELSALLVYYVLKGYAIESHCEEGHEEGHDGHDGHGHDGHGHEDGHEEHGHEEHSDVDKELFVEWLFDEYFNITENGTISEEAFEKILSQLNIGQATAGTEAESHSEEDHSGHNHRRKRSLAHLHRLSRQRRAVVAHDDHDHNENLTAVEKCFSGETLLTIFGVDHEAGVTKSQFQQICPALLQQQISGSCTVKKNETTSTKSEPTNAQKYGYGTLAVGIITVTSVAGLFVFPCMNKKFYQYVMMTLIALAVGTMCGDALLHLIPHALELHAHDHDAGHGQEKHIIVDEFVWKMTVVFCAIYFFFLLEHILGSAGHGHSHSGPSTEEHLRHTNIPGNDTLETVAEMKKNKGTESTMDLASSTFSVPDPELQSNGHHHSYGSLTGTAKSAKEAEAKTDVKVKGKPIRTVGYMVLVGDTIHNLADGMAIGAAFSFSVESGIATSIAVFCHELPHEFGDFAVLLKSGFSFKKAMLFNFVSALACFVGLYLGIAVAIDSEVKMWIFVVVAGMFLYISLADMLPEVISMRTENFWLSFIVQNIGIILGFVLMLLIAIFEEYITV